MSSRRGSLGAVDRGVAIALEQRHVTGTYLVFSSHAERGCNCHCWQGCARVERRRALGVDGVVVCALTWWWSVCRDLGAGGVGMNHQTSFGEVTLHRCVETYGEDLLPDHAEQLNGGRGARKCPGEGERDHSPCYWNKSRCGPAPPCRRSRRWQLGRLYHPLLGACIHS